LRRAIAKDREGAALCDDQGSLGGIDRAGYRRGKGRKAAPGDESFSGACELQ